MRRTTPLERLVDVGRRRAPRSAPVPPILDRSSSSRSCVGVARRARRQRRRRPTATSSPTRRPSRPRSAKQIAEQKARGRPDQRAPGGPRPADRGDHEASSTGINADLAAVRKTINKMAVQIEARQGSSTTRSSRRLQLLDAQLATSSRQEKRQARRARRATKAAARRRASARPTTPTGRRCSRRSCRAARSPTSLAEVELLHRRRRAGQGARRADRHATRRRSPRSTQTVEATRGQTDDAAGRDGRSRSAQLDAQPRRAQGGPGAAQGAREGDRPARSPSQKAAYAQLSRNKKDLAKAIATAAGGPEARSPRKIDRPRRRSSSRAGNIPSEYNGTLRWPMGGHGHAASSAAAGSRATAPGNGCAHFHNGIDIVAPVRRAGPGRRRRARSSTSAGTTPTAPTRPGS